MKPGQTIEKNTQSNLIRPPCRRYDESAGASAMSNDLPRRFERAAYNYLDISPNDEAYREVDPGSLALQFHKFALFNSGVRGWENIAEILITAAAQAKRIKNAEGNPIWVAMFRHARNAATREIAEEFLRHSIIHQHIDDKAWLDMPEPLKFEALQYAASCSRARQARIMSAESVRIFFSSEEFQIGSILGVCYIYHRENNDTELKHALQVLHDLDPDVYYLRKEIYSGFLFRLVRYRAKVNGLSSDVLTLYKDAWARAAALPLRAEMRPVRYKAMNDLYDERVSAAKALQDEDAVHAAHEDWRRFLELQISQIDEIRR